MKQSLLVELNTEELPPKALQSLSEAFASGLAKGLRDRHFLSDDSVVTPFGAPRRLAVHITHVLNRSPDKAFKQKLMPLAVARDAASQWTHAFLKKLESLGRRHMASVPVGTHDGPDCLVVESDGRADSVFLQAVQPGQSLLVALQSSLEESIAALPIPKVMSYQLEDGTTTVQFVRPAHRLIAMRGHEVLPVTALGLLAGTTTHGHRFMEPGDLPVHSADTYETQLEEEGLVIPSFDKRRARIANLVKKAAASFDATPIMPDELLDEVTALVEWPVVYDSGFEREFLEVPPECLILTMQQNQKYFALRDKTGRLMNRFLLVSHIEATDDGAAIRAGNARVVRARLADAKFFYDQDRKETLESRIPGLAHVVYHNRIGSQLERVERIIGIAVALAKELDVDRTHVERAARLAKADLRTLMVGEFPELQGIMGEYYARHDGETTDVAMAIREHYQPRFAGDALPTSKVGLCVALGDKLETLVGLFGIGEKPTGERDPYGLRRHALGVLRMLMEKSLPLPLPRMLTLVQSEFSGVQGFQPAESELTEFLYDRLRGLLRDDGYTAHEVEAVVAQAPARIDLVPSQLAAVRAFMELPEAESLAAANKRIGNILKKAEGVPQSFDTALLMEPAERSLGDAFAGVQPSADRLYASGD
ncbi:MAG TPA: glycine--tRNA ligase subunit beta, partial [Burkholderiaceae bacterium]|nr:glycine--tRNA ligase subunit beta [Burkholderiaceae bacterium]